MRRIALAGLALLAVAGAALAQEHGAREHEVKAAFLLKFPDFVEWPAPPKTREPFVIAVLEADEVAAELRRFARGRAVNGRPIEVREGAPEGAQLVFVGRAAAGRLAEIASAAERALIVSESPGALERGSMINFVLLDGRVRFEVAPDAAERRRLRISSRLLAVAHNVRGADR